MNAKEKYGDSDRYRKVTNRFYLSEIEREGVSGDIDAECLHRSYSFLNSLQTFWQIDIVDEQSVFPTKFVTAWPRPVASLGGRGAEGPGCHHLNLFRGVTPDPI